MSGVGNTLYTVRSRRERKYIVVLFLFTSDIALE